MARSSGPLHSNSARGTVGPLTHRIWRGNGTVSRHRSPSRIRLRPSAILSPENILNCFARFNAGIGTTLRFGSGGFFLVSLADLIGGFGLASQPSVTRQPKWFDADPAHNNKPYILPDGSDDYLTTPLLPAHFHPPLDVWIVAEDCGVPTSDRVLFNLSSTMLACLNASASATYQWLWNSPLIGLLAPWSISTVKVWRLIINPSTIQLFWNGVPQSDPKTISTLTFDLLRFFAPYYLTALYNRRLFEIAFWRRILNPVEAALLLRYYTETFNIV